MTNRSRARLRLWRRSFRTASPYEGAGMVRTLLLSVLVGVLAGLAAMALSSLLQLFDWLFLGRVAGVAAGAAAGEPEPFDLPAITGGVRLWAVALLPALGGLATGLFVDRAAPEAAGGGTDAAIEAYHFRGGRVRPAVIPVKTLATAVLIGTGGSAGGEGPISQIGAGVGSLVAGWFRLPVAQRRVLMAAGTGAGMGALFHAPLAGALFAAEILYRDLDLEYEVLVPAIIASVTSSSLFSFVFGFKPLFDTPDISFSHPQNLLLYIVLAAVLSLGARFYVWSLYKAQDRFGRLRVPRALRPAIGGLLTGLVGLVFLRALGSGYGTIQEALHFDSSFTLSAHGAAFGMLAGVFFFKTLATAFSVGSGGSGGVFGPAIVAGGALGGAVGMLFASALPSWNVPVGAFVLVGMASFFGCAAKTPISSILMVSEMTGNFRLLVPAMWVCILAYLLSRKVSLYRSQLPNRFEAPVHRGSLVAGTLGALTVRDLLAARRGGAAFATVTPGTPVAALFERADGAARQDVFPVLAADGSLAGVVSRRDAESTLAGDPVLRQTLLVEDLSAAPHPVVREDEPLRSVLAKMDADDAEGIVVVSATVPPRPLGVVTHNDAAAAYQVEIAAAR